MSVRWCGITDTPYGGQVGCLRCEQTITGPRIAVLSPALAGVHGLTERGGSHINAVCVACLEAMRDDDAVFEGALQREAARPPSAPRVGRREPARGVIRSQRHSLYDERRSRGVCVFCAAPAGGYARCVECRRKKQDAAKRRRKARA